MRSYDFNYVTLFSKQMGNDIPLVEACNLLFKKNATELT